VRNRELLGFSLHVIKHLAQLQTYKIAVCLYILNYCAHKDKRRDRARFSHFINNQVDKEKMALSHD